ncbi:right-handed parallel beta-helix repeat-containing protein [Roseovarius tibetensis]|uniref:right-handed parallel beta-helix repeat-containing protein n=1 Tax=Roseovarius tibetensis TaxID=2685897 RepID=UPI003D800186
MSDIFSVSGAAELRKALVDAKGGDRIELAGGDYGQLDLMTFKTFGVKAIYDSPVTITSADPGDRASFSGMDLREVRNLTFDNVVFDSGYTGGDHWVGPFSVRNSEGITIRNSLFAGELASGTGDPAKDGFATGKGLSVGGSSDVAIEGNEFTTWHRGMVIGGSENVRVIGNDVHSMRSDGMNFAGVRNVRIEDNHLHDFARSKSSGDHSDMIQFWTNGTSRPSTDIVIRGNTLDAGDGDGTQSIFMRNELVDRGLAGEEMFYRNLLIEENVILNNHTHGISVGETDGLVIRRNSVLDADAEISATVATPRINLKAQSKNVVVEQNATAAINGHTDQPGWTVSGNALVQNTGLNAPGHYATEFIHSSLGGAAEAYLPDPDGTIAQLGAGASRLHLDTTPDSLRAAFDVSNDPGGATSVVFDAAHTYGPTGALAADDALFVWDFGDGTGATGQVVRHGYAEAGHYDATLTVVTPDGATAAAQGGIAIMGADMLTFDPQTGAFLAEGYGEATPVEGSDSGSVAQGDGHVIDLGGSGTAVGIPPDTGIARLFGAESFEMSMTLRADTPGSTGEVARVHGNFTLSVANRGEVSFSLWTDEARADLTTTHVTVNDGEDHDIRIVFDGASDRLEIHVDDALAAVTELEGAVRGDYPRGLTFGNPWGKENFDGTLTAFDMEVGKQDYPDYAGDTSAIPEDAIPVDNLPSIAPDATDPAQNDSGGATSVVFDAAELRKALVDAKGGDRIELAGGDYGQLDLMTFKTFGVKAIYDSPVTITSADPGDRASFSGMDLREVRNLTFDNVVFDSGYTGGDHWVGPFSVRNSEGITIRNSLFAGELASGTGDPAKDGFATGKGLSVGGSSDVAIEGNEFTTWHRGMVIGGSENVRVIGNDVHSMRSDGMNFAGVRNVRIEDNHLHDFARSKSSGDHSDMIQFWTNGTSRPSTDIVIRGNTLDAGDGDGTQSIFMRNELVDRGLAGEEMFYRNLLIEENVILNNHTHGISVGETDGLVIRRNSVLDADAEISATVATPRINLKAQSKNVVVEQNATAAINGHTDQPGWTVSGNALVQNTGLNAPGHYATEFIHSSLGGAAEAYLPDPDGTIAQLGAGASRLHLDTTPDSLRAAFDVSNDPGGATSVVFDAAHTYGPTGALAADDALFVWDFGDGTGATGQVVRHGYAEAGHYDATLTVVTPDGATAAAQGGIAIMGADMLTFDPQTGAFLAEGYGEATPVEGSDSGSVAQGDGHAIDLGGSGTAVGIPPDTGIARLFGAESFEMSMTLRADTPGSTGEVARVHGNFTLSVANRGEVSFSLWTDEARADLTTTHVTVNDGEDHDIRIVFDGASDRLEIHVDDALAAVTELEGAVRGDYPRGLTFGNPWGKENFDGTLTAFDMEVGKQDYPDYAGDTSAIPEDAIPVDNLPSIAPDATDPAQNDTPQTAAPDENDAQGDSDPAEEPPTTQDRTEAPGDEAPDQSDEVVTQGPNVVIDTEADRLEVILDDTVAHDGTDADPVLIAISPAGFERDGAIGTAWTHQYDSFSDPDDTEIFVDDALML